MLLQPAGKQADTIARWERARSRGRTWFVWLNGVAMWGLPAALLTIAYKVFQEHGRLGVETLNAPFSQKLRVAIAISLVFFPALGHLLGQRLWVQGEANYERLKGRDQGP